MTSNYAVTDPRTGEIHSTYASMTDAELAACVRRSVAAGREWGLRSEVAARAERLRLVADRHAADREELARIIHREMGKREVEALAEVDFSADIYRYYAERAEQFLADEPVELRGGTGSAVIRTAPVGVLLGIMPWNFPYYQIARFAAPNLALGNTVLLKPAPQCPESAAAVQRIFDQVGAGPAYQTVYASNDQVAGLIADPGVAGVSLTGSERAGAAVAEAAGRNLKPVVLELGGSDPFVVLSTDDLDAVVADAVAARIDNAGQVCNGAKRFVVHADLFDDFRERFTRGLLAAADQLAPLSSREAARRLGQQLDEAVAHGAHAAQAGVRDGAFFPAVVLTGVERDNPAYRQEFFGPVAMLFRAEDEADAIRLANDTPYGLGSYVYTTDPEQARRVADRLEVGMVFVNGVMLDAAELPFGGVKRSGFGRELGRLAMTQFANHKLIREA